MSQLVSLVARTATCLSNKKDTPTPKYLTRRCCSEDKFYHDLFSYCRWLSFVILILDLYQNVSSPYYLKQACRKKVLNATIFCLLSYMTVLLQVPRMWQFFDERNHRWHNYSNASNATLNDLYNKDEPIAR